MSYILVIKLSGTSPLSLILFFCEVMTGDAFMGIIKES